MKILFLLAISSITLNVFAQDYLEDTIDVEKYEDLKDNCKNEFDDLEEEENDDIYALYDTLLKIQSSKNCSKIQSFSPEELGRTRGGAPCSINPKNKLTGISYGKIGVVLANGQKSSLDWDTAHIAEMSNNDYLYKGTQFAEPFVKQLMEKGLCQNLSMEPKKSPKTNSSNDKKSCQKELTIQSISDYKVSDFYNDHQVFWKNKVGKVKSYEIEYSYTDKNGKECTEKVYDTNGVMLTGLIFQQVKSQINPGEKPKTIKISSEQINLLKHATGVMLTESKSLTKEAREIAMFAERAKTFAQESKVLAEVVDSIKNNEISYENLQKALSVYAEIHAGYQPTHYATVENIKGDCVTKDKGDAGTVKHNGKDVKIARYSLNSILNINQEWINPWELDAKDKCGVSVIPVQYNNAKENKAKDAGSVKQ